MTIKEAIKTVNELLKDCSGDMLYTDVDAITVLRNFAQKHSVDKEEPLFMQAIHKSQKSNPIDFKDFDNTKDGRHVACGQKWSNHDNRKCGQNKKDIIKNSLCDSCQNSCKPFHPIPKCELYKPVCECGRNTTKD